MRIMFIAQNIPYPPNDGGKIVVYNTLRAVAERGHEVAIVGLTVAGESVPAEFSTRYQSWHCEAELGDRTVGLLKGLFSPTPYNYAKCRPRGFSDVVLSAARAFRPDVIQVDFLHMAVYGLAVSEQLKVPVVIRAHNVDSLLMARFRDSQRNPVVKAYAALQVDRLLRTERDLLPRFDRRVAITSADARALSRISGEPFDWIPAGVDTAYYRPEPGTEEPNSFVSVALMRWLPNIVGMRWFLHEVFPSIRRELPSARLYIVGKDPPLDIRRQHDDTAVVVTGFVPDIRPWVAKCPVFVVPTRVGSGMRIKVLEALAMGKAVVSTTIGCEGIDGLVDGENIVLADTAADFASAVVGLMHDRGKRERLGRAGRKLVTDLYQWSAVADQFTEIYEQVVSDHRGTAR